MTASLIEIHAGAEDRAVARLAALATGLWLLESALPSPLPGVKPGFANIVVLVALHRHGLGPAAWVAVLRVLAGSLLFGTLFTPGFTLGLAGAAGAIALLAVGQRLPARLFGPVSHSLLAAVGHLAGQLGIAYGWLIPHAGIVYLLPVLAAAALLTGAVNGLVAAWLLHPHEGAPDGGGGGAVALRDPA